MKIAYVCVMINGLIPIFIAGLAKVYGGFELKDNANSREFLAKQEGKSKRANWAQANAWEAFAPFAAGVIIASISNVDTTRLSIVCVVYTVARLAYVYAYIANLPSTRSLVWGLALTANLYCYYLALTSI